MSVPTGTDVSDTWVHVDRQGKIHVFHNRIDCSNQRFGTDLYRFIDPWTVTLTVTKEGNGEGTVTADGIDCGGDCTQDYEPGTTVTLTATPAEGSRFAGWSEETCGTQTTCTIQMTADRTVTATFR